MPTDTSVFTDKSGRDVKTGDIIVYGHALGRCAGLRYGKVLGFRPNESHASFEEACAVKLQVIGVNDDWSHLESELLERVSYVQFPERVLILERTQVPDRVLRLLDNYSG